MTGAEADAVALQLGSDHVALRAHHVMRAEQQVLDPDPALGTERLAYSVRWRRPERSITASRSVLLGMVPVLMQTPPTSCCFSHIATRLRSLAAWVAARWPPGPLPMTIRSKLCMRDSCSRVDDCAVHAQDHVAGFQASLGGWAVLLHGNDERALPCAGADGSPPGARAGPACSRPDFTASRGRYAAAGPSP